MYEQQNVKKVCSFCVSDLHLITMLLPHLNKKVKENEKIITILEKDLTEQVKLVLERLVLNNKDKENLLNINWNSRAVFKFELIEKEINKICENNDKLNIIVNGTKEYIEKVNKVLENNIIKHEVKIINCYDITKLDDDIKYILKTHDIILNTSGEKEISEVFEGYEKRKYA